MVCHWSLAGLAVAMLMGAVVPAFAQSPLTGRTYRGLFGSGLQGTNHSLTFDGNFGGGLDTNVLTAGPALESDPAIQSRSSGSFGRGSMALGYNLKLSRINLTARGGGVVARYTNRVRPWIQTYHGDVTASAPLWTGANISTGYSATFRPFYYLPWLGGVAGVENIEGPSPEIDETAGSIGEYHTNTNGTVSLTQNVTQHASLGLTYGHQQSVSDSGARDLHGQNGSAAMNFRIAKGLSLRLGYGFSETRYASQQSYHSRNIIAGLGFNRALSLTRSTTLSFNFGSSAVADHVRTYYRLDAHATLTHELGRTWTAQAVYNRNVSFDDAFHVPVPIDAVSVGVRGLFSRQLAFNSSIGWVNGALGFGSFSNHFESYYGRSALIWGLSRIFGVGLDYAYYQYRFDDQTQLQTGMARRADRHNIRAFVTMRAALFKGRNRGSR